jgi:hypothetical protein
MSSQYSDYPTHARRLADAGAGLLDAITDPAMDRSLSIVELENATTTVQSNDLRARFEPASGIPAAPAKRPEDVLSGILLDLQSANALISAGLAMNEQGRGAESQHLAEAVAQIRATSGDLATHIAKSAKLQFAPQTHPSPTVEEALKLFRDSAGRTLDSIATGTEGIINAAVDKLKKVDPSKVLEAIDNLGTSFEVAATTGRLIRKGLEKFKAVLDALSHLFDSETLSDIKDEVRELWDKYGGESKLLRGIIGLPAAQKRVNDFAALPGLGIPVLDGVSRDLALLEDRYQGMRKVLDGLESAIVLATGLVGTLNFFGVWAAAPWVPLVIAGAYVAVIGSAVLVGLNYTGSRPLFGWIRGVCEIIKEQQMSRAAP